MVDYLHIHCIVTAEVDVNLCTQELLGKHGNIEAIGIEACNVAALKIGSNVARHLFEGGAILNILVVNSMHGRRLGGNGHSRVYAHVSRQLVAVGHHLNVAYFHDAVGGNIDTRCFEVEEYNRFFKIQFHLLLC